VDESSTYVTDTLSPVDVLKIVSVESDTETGSPCDHELTVD
jgi:hypothetical protein